MASPRKLTISCIHQSAELYGSDRSFASAVNALSKCNDFSISVCLPTTGPLESLFDVNTKIRFKHLWVLRRATFLKDITLGLPSILFAIVRAFKTLIHSDITYINTCVIADHLIAAAITRQKAIVHVREIPTGLELYIIRCLLRASGASVVFNSEATQKAFALPAKSRQCVIWNGFEDPGIPGATLANSAPAKHFNILCLGRINSWKGQIDLVSAFAMLPTAIQEQSRVKIVGGIYPGQEKYLEELTKAISSSQYSSHISLECFTKDPSSLYEWADVVVIPSKKPEPFGRVAIEAMAHSRAVIASAHGGLLEIVEHGKTGFLFQPNQIDQLAEMIECAFTDRDRVKILGDNGRARFISEFTIQSADEKLVNFVENTRTE